MEAIIFIGVQGSGKTTFYHERFCDTHVRLSLDLLRTRERQEVLMRACLGTAQRFVVDNTNVLVTERARYIAAAKAANFRVIGYFFRSELRAAIGRNKSRAGKLSVPIPGLIATWKRLQPPSLTEGFDELYTVEIRPNKTFSVEPFLAAPPTQPAPDPD